MNRQTTIEKAFYSAINGLGLTYVSWPNGPSISPPTTSINYSMDIEYGEGDCPEMTLGAALRFEGVFRITVRCPVTDSFGNAPGMLPGITAAEYLRDQFKRGTVLSYTDSLAVTTNVTCRTPTITHRGKVTAEWYSLLVSIPFRSDVLYG